MRQTLSPPLTPLAPAPVLNDAAPAATPIPRIDFGCAGLRMTPEEFDAIAEYDDLYHYELVDGVLVVNAIPAKPERRISLCLSRLLLNYREDHPQGAALSDMTFEEYVRLPNSRRRADLVLWIGLGRLSRKQEQPTLAIEIVSRSKRDWRRDYVAKRDEYLAAGVREYWIVDRFRRTLTVFRPGPEGPLETVIQEQETYRPELLPGFELPLAKLLAAAGPEEEDDA